MPEPIWQCVSFPPDRDIADSEVYLFVGGIVAVLFFVDKNLRYGEPRVWKELNAVWGSKFGLAPGGVAPGRPTWDDDHNVSIVSGGFSGGRGIYATVQSMVDPTQTKSMHILPALSLDLAISGGCDLLGQEEENWLNIPKLLWSIIGINEVINTYYRPSNNR